MEETAVEAGQKTKYDITGRVLRETVFDTDVTEEGQNARLYETRYEYDKLDQVKKALVTAGGRSLTTGYSYNENRQPETLTMSAASRNYSYDSLGRLKGKSLSTTAAVAQDYIYYSSDRNDSIANGTDGLRTKKTVGNEVHEYYYSGGQLMYEKRGSKEFYYTYDFDGGLSRISYYSGSGNPVLYYPVTNVRGDVQAIFDSSGNLVAEYTYDAWGNTIEIRDGSGADITDQSNIGHLNRISYRGYYYDAETGFYYVSSRYYDSESGRFISADDVEYLGANGTIPSYNLYAYCENNPVNMIDADGHAAIHFAFAAIGGLVGWKLGDYVAKKLGYRSGKKYWAIRAGVTIGGAAIGWFSARLMTQILTGYLRSNPSLIFKMSSKWGVSKFNSVMKFLGINPFKLSMNSSKFIGIARLYNNKSVTLGYNWAISLYNKAKSLGFKVMLDKPHGGYGWHIHLSGANGKLSNLHIQISKSAWKYLSKLIK